MTEQKLNEDFPIVDPSLEVETMDQMDTDPAAGDLPEGDTTDGGEFEE